MAVSQARPRNLGFSDPDCLRCLRLKLNAICVAVFYREGEGWRLGDFQGDKPRSAAEAEFMHMLRVGLPEAIAKRGRGFILVDERDVETAFPALTGLFLNSTVIASAVCGGEAPGVRIAWRDKSEPFTDADLEIIHCLGNCPDECKAG